MDRKIDDIGPQGSSSEQAITVDQSVLNEVFGNDVGLQLAILQKFAQQAGQVVGECETAFQKRDAGVIAFQTHKLKSSARTVGANQLADTCLALELVGKNADWRQIENLFPILRSASDRVMAHIGNMGTIAITSESRV
jgi:HPt (histidine-containing phosphotransfer) domain-containing protein